MTEFDLPRRDLLKAAAVVGGLAPLVSARTSMAATSPGARVRVAVINDYPKYAPMVDWSTVTNRATVDFYHDHIFDEDALARRLASYDVVCTERYRTRFTANLLSKMPRLKLLVSTTPATAHIDMDQAAKQNILVCGTASGVSVGGNVSELAFGHVLCAARQIPQHNNDTKAGKWQARQSSMVYGKTLGIIGLGKTGQEMVGYAKPFKMKTLAWSQNLTPEAAIAGGSTRVELSQLLRESDFVSIHYILSDRSRNMIRAEHFAQMKPTAFFFNTSRGGVINEADLIQALQQKKIAGAGLDVFQQEPVDPKNPLLRMDNVIVTPHNGYVEDAPMLGIYRQTVEDVAAWLDGKPIRILKGKVQDEI